MTDTKGGGFDPEQMKKQFTDIWKQTVEQLEDIREAVVKASQTAKERLDATFLRRERDRLYQQLGEDTFVLIESGKLKAPIELQDTMDRIHVLAEQLDEAEAEEARAAAREPDLEPTREAAEDNGEKAAKAETKKAASKKKAPAKKKTARKTSKKAGATKKKASKKKATTRKKKA